MRLSRALDFCYNHPVLNDRSGATAIEYALIASLIAVAAILAYMELGDTLVEVWNHITTEVAGT